MKRITLLSKNGTGTPVYLPMPQMDSIVEFNMAFKFHQTTDKTYRYFDNGFTYDFRTSSSKYLLTKSEMTAFINFYEDQARSRSDRFQFRLDENCGFYPFGNDLGCSGIFQVQFKDARWTTRLNKPWDMHELTLDLHLYSSPYYEVPSTSYKQGSFILDNITGLPNPDIYFEYENHFNIKTSLGGKLKNIDSGKSNYMYSSKFIFDVSVQNAALILNKLKSIRTNAFIITTPSKCYPFGSEFGFGNFSVSLINNLIKVTNNGKNNYRIEIEVGLQNVL